MNPFSQMKLLKLLPLLLHVIFGEENVFQSGERDSILDPHDKYFIVVSYLAILAKTHHFRGVFHIYIQLYSSFTIFTSSYNQTKKG